MNKKQFYQLLRSTAPQFDEYFDDILSWNIHKHVTNVLEEYSGGGCYHLFLHLKDGRIISINPIDDMVEISFSFWNSLSEYYSSTDDGPKFGFGFEYLNPEYENRVHEIKGAEKIFYLSK